jgi:long-chain acyl-CoA synthetase
MSQPGGSPSTHAKSATCAWLDHYPKGVDWYKNYTAKPLWSLLDHAVEAHPTKICTNFLGKTLTYREIGAQVDAIAAGLAAAGVGKGSRVGLLLPNCPTFIGYYFAALKLGATVVNYNPLYSIEELAQQVEDSKTQLIVTLDLKALFAKVEALLRQGTLAHAVVCSFPSLLPAAKAVLFKLLKSRELAHPAKSDVADKVTLEVDLLKGGSSYEVAEIDPETDIAVLQYTGGTTGTPKGAMLTHANLYINVHQVSDWSPSLIEAQERVFGVLPFFHVFAMTVVMNNGIQKAAEIIIMPRFVLDDALKLIHKTKPTVMPGVPTLFNAIIHHPKLASFDLSSLKFCISGGAPLALDLKERFQSLTGCKLVEGYGLSETSPVVTCNSVDGPVKDGSIGQPLPQTTISLRDLADPEQEVAPGEKGELCIKGPQVMAGYWNNPEATRQAFVGDFLRTGDVAVMDDEGYFYIVDRIKDLIICSGFNVYPRRIEEAVYDHPDVEEVTVIGIKDAYRGEAPKAFVKLKKGAQLSADDLMAHLEPKLSKIEMPVEIEFRTELPKTMIGKLSKKELKQQEDDRRAADA